MLMYRRTCRLVGALSLLLFLGACSHTLQSSRLQQVPPQQIPLAWELDNTPFFAQSRYQCGPAALATMLVYRRVSVVPDGLTDKVYLPQREGSVTVEMEATARRYGMLVYPLAPSLESALREVAAGNPVLVLQNLGFEWLPRWHYAVLIGYDLNAGKLILRSGVTRRYVVSMGLFKKTWRRADFWARVIIPPASIPVSADAIHTIEAAVALEQSRQDAAALTAYRAATERWPDSTLAWLARGNLAYRLGRHEEAETSYRFGLKADPAHAALWNNLAYALAHRHCGAAAQAAVCCAIDLAPDIGQYRDSLRELQGSVDDTAACGVITCPPPSVMQDH